MPPGITFAVRWLLSLAAAGVICLALLVGLLRLLLPLAPHYQEEIRRQFSAATGYGLNFASISASWPLAGPELSFYDVALTAPGGGAPLLGARELSVGVSLLRLLRDRELSVARLRLDGASVAVERASDGRLRLQGRWLEDLLPIRRQTGLRALKVRLEEIGVRFTDRRLDRPVFALHVEELRVDVEPTAVALEGELVLDERYGREVDVGLEFPVTPGQTLAFPSAWRGRLGGRDVDVAALAGYVLGDSLPLRAARGDIRIAVDIDAADHQKVAVETDLREVVIGSGAGAAAYDSVSGVVDWARTPEGWDTVARRVRMRRGQRAWPLSTMELHYRRSSESMPAQWVGGASFARLEDLLPLVRSLAAGTEFGSSLPRSLQGDLRDFTGEFSVEAEAPARFSLRAAFENLGFTSATGAIGGSNLSGSVVADGNGGRLELTSTRPSLVLQEWFRETLSAEQLDGTLSWRSGPTGIRLQSGDIHVAGPGLTIRSQLTLDFPADRSSPVIDLRASASAAQAREILRYLPLRRFAPPVVSWLERAVIGGRVPEATVEFRGPVRDFPYASGEGVFRVSLGLQEGTLDYAEGWPRVEEFNGTILFDGVSMSSTQNEARVGNLRIANYTVRIPDLRQGILALSGRQQIALDEILRFLRSTPVASTLGPTLGRVNGSGPVTASLRLALPLKALRDYDLQVIFDARGCRLGWQGLDFGFEKLTGRARLRNTRLDASRMSATFLDAPVEIAVVPTAQRDATVSHVVTVRGTTPVPSVVRTFRLPLPERFTGEVDWTAVARLPARPGVGPLRIGVRSDLVGAASTMPQPLVKSPETAWPLDLELVFPNDGVIEVTGGLRQPDVAWALRLVSTGRTWRLERGAVEAGGRSAQLPDAPGVALAGRVPELRFSEWLALGEGGDGNAWRELYREARLRIDRFSLIGQVFRNLDLTAQRGPDGWTVDVATPNVIGRISVPFDLRGATPLALDMQRLWLKEPDTAAGTQSADPREVPALQVRAADAALGSWHFGALELTASRVADGLIAQRLATRAGSFTIDGDGAWQVSGNDGRQEFTRLKFTLVSTNVKETLAQLGYDPVIDARGARVQVSILWPGAPSADFLREATGQITVAIDKGQVLNVEPGSGRLLGLLSVTALPRRLALDFRDVFRKGLAFDSIRGDFRLGGGSAYTCNLGLEGPAAGLAVIGKTKLVEREYDQLAVVRPAVSNVLAVGGAVLGGPVGGATMLLISQLFRKPLSTLGESYYRMSGSWDKPVVTRIERNQADTSAFKDCERELAATLQAIEEMAGAAGAAQSVTIGGP